MFMNRKRISSLFLALTFMFTLITSNYVTAVTYDDSNISVKTFQADLIQEGATTQSSSVFTAKRYDARKNTTLTLEEAMYDAFINVEPSVNLSKYKVTSEEVFEVFAQIINFSPELFYVDNKIQSYYNTATNYVAVTNLFYNYTNDEINEMKIEFDEEVDYILSTLDENMSDLEKILAVHEYFLVHFTYDYTYSIYNAYDILINKTGVCQAYALAYKYILNQLDIECWLVTSDTINHAWNIVNLDGVYYHVDVTWNDNYQTLGKASHDNLLKSEDAIIELGHTDINEIYLAEDTTYDNYFWVEITNGMTYLDGKWYYISRSGHMTSYDFAIDEMTAIYKPKIFTSFYTLYSNVQTYNGKLLYNSQNTIYSVNADGTDETPIYTLAKDETRSIFGIAVYKDELIFTLKKSADDDDNFQYLSLNELFDEEEPITEPTETTTEIENPIVLGDLDGDSVVTIVDVVILIKALQGNYDLSEEFAANADVVEDGNINVYDLIAIKKILLQ